MERQPLEIHLKIVSFLDVPDLLTCRLVSHAWNGTVEAHLAKVTHVKLNQNLLDDSPVPSIFYKNLYPQRFMCPEAKLVQLFAFIRKKCPNLKIFSATTSTIQANTLMQLPKNIHFLEVNMTYGTNRFAGINSIIATDSDYCNCSQVPDAVARHFLHSPLQELEKEGHAAPVPHTRWKTLSHLANHEREQLPPCPSLEVLKLVYNQGRDEVCPSFFYPNLKYLKCKLRLADYSPLFDSIRYSPELRAIEVDDVPDVQVLDRLVAFAATFESLRLLKIRGRNIWSFGLSIPVPLSKNLKHLTLQTNRSVVFVEEKHESLEVLCLQCATQQPNVFNFPVLREASLTLNHPGKGSSSIFDSLLHSPRLRLFHLKYLNECTFEQIGEVFQVVHQLKHLQDVHIAAECKTQDADAPVLDLLQHREMKKVQLNIDSHSRFYRTNMLSRCGDLQAGSFMVSLNQMSFPELVFDSSGVTLKTKQQIGKYGTLNFNIKGKLDGCFYVPLVGDFCSLRDLRIFLCDNSVSCILKKLAETIAKLPQLKTVRWKNSQNFHLFFNDAQTFVNQVLQKPSLESFDMDLNIYSLNRNKTFTLDIDVSSSALLRQLSVKLQLNAPKAWPKGVERRFTKISAPPREAKRVFTCVKLGNFYERLEFCPSKLSGKLMGGGCFAFSFDPKVDQIDLPEPMDQLQSIFISNWLRFCGSYKWTGSRNGRDPFWCPPQPLLIELVNKFPNLKDLAGDVEMKFLEPFFAHFKHPLLILNVAFKPKVEQINRKNELHFQILWVE